MLAEDEDDDDYDDDDDDEIMLDKHCARDDIQRIGDMAVAVLSHWH
jgi:hypothetical protein